MGRNFTHLRQPCCLRAAPESMPHLAPQTAQQGCLLQQRGPRALCSRKRTCGSESRAGRGFPAVWAPVPCLRSALRVGAVTWPTRWLEEQKASPWGGGRGLRLSPEGRRGAAETLGPPPRDGCRGCSPCAVVRGPLSAVSARRLPTVLSRLVFSFLSPVASLGPP